MLNIFKNKKNELIESNNLYKEDIINKLLEYNIYDTFLSLIEIEDWISNLNCLEINNILSLQIEKELIKFDPQLLIDKNLLNTIDYNKRIEAIASIKNADGWYHLFDSLLNEDFIKSDKFYKDIETMKRSECAQMSLWIIGDSDFINSPYHDEDFEILVTSKDTSEDENDYVLWDSIATLAKSHESINSIHHREDMKKILKYSSPSLQMSNSFPKRAINNLAIDPVSLLDLYHLENMDILANNKSIGNFLYAVMTNKEAIEKKEYRNIIREMVENKECLEYVFLLCYYAVGEKEARRAENILIHDYFYELSNNYNMEDLLKKVEEKINTIDGIYKEIVTYEIEQQNNLIEKIFFKKRNNKYLI